MKAFLLTGFIILFYLIAIGQDKVVTKTNENSSTPKGTTQKSKTTTQNKKITITKKAKGKNSNIPETALDFLMIGNHKKELDDLEAAKIEYNKAIEVDANYHLAYLARGAVNFILQDFNASLNDFNKTIELTNTLIEASIKRGNVKTILEDWKGAAKEFNKANNLKPLMGEALYNRGNVKFFLEDKEGCCTDLEEAGKYGFLQAYSYMKKYCQ